MQTLSVAKGGIFSLDVVHADLGNGADINAGNVPPETVAEHCTLRQVRSFAAECFHRIDRSCNTICCQQHFSGTQSTRKALRQNLISAE